MSNEITTEVLAKAINKTKKSVQNIAVGSPVFWNFKTVNPSINSSTNPPATITTSLTPWQSRLLKPMVSLIMTTLLSSTMVQIVDRPRLK